MKGLLLLVCLGAVPGSALAQATLSGTVTDPAGLPLPGVSVQATSPALIERARLTVTDDRGKYRIEDLRPGPYTITFTRPGWQTAVTTGVDLAGSATAAVDMRLFVSALQETVTVRADLPLVDANTSNRESTLSRAVVTTIPTVRSYNALLVV